MSRGWGWVGWSGGMVQRKFRESTKALPRQVSPREVLYTLKYYHSRCCTVRFVFPRVLWVNMWIATKRRVKKKRSHCSTNLRSIVITPAEDSWLLRGLEVLISDSGQGHSGNNMQWFPNAFDHRHLFFLMGQGSTKFSLGVPPVCNNRYISKYVHTFIYLFKCIF